MRIVIIGGLGFIGRAFANEAVKAGHLVTVLTRGRKVMKADTAQLKIETWDGVTSEDLVPLIDGTDAVVNLAGESIGKGRWTKERKNLILSSRTMPGKALVKAWERVQNKPRILLQSSAIGYYGTGKASRTENSQPGTDELARICVEWESPSLTIEKMGSKRIIIRTGVVLSTLEGVLPQFLLPFRLLIGGSIGSGQQVLSWIHIDDQIRAMLFLLENAESGGVFNLTAPNPVTNAEMGKSISRATKLPFWFRVPAFMLKFILGEMSTLILDGQRVQPERLLEMGFKFEFPEIQPALENLLSTKK